MLKPDTIHQLQKLTSNDIVHVLERAYASYAKEYYDSLNKARCLEGLHVHDDMPSLEPDLAPCHQDREQEKERALRNAQHAYNMSTTLDSLLRDLHAAHHTNFARDIAEYLKNRG